FSSDLPSGNRAVMRPCSLVSPWLSSFQFLPSCFSRVTFTSGDGRPFSRFRTCTLSGLPAASATLVRLLRTAPAHRVFSIFIGKLQIRGFGSVLSGWPCWHRPHPCPHRRRRPHRWRRSRRCPLSAARRRPAAEARRGC